MTSKDKYPWPQEPVLDMGDIQGIAVPGFLKPSQTLLGLRYSRTEASVSRLKAFIKDFAAETASAADTLADRRAHRTEGGRAEPKPPLAAIGISYRGLFDLTPGALLISSEAFRHGLAARSALLGDPVDPKDPGHPANWLVGGPDNELDILIVIAGDDRPSVDRRSAEVRERLAAIGVDVITQRGDIREDARGKEHFGFDDGISQPGIRGRASADPADFITDRWIDPAAFPAAAVYGLPGQDLVWPGEFVIGYPRTGPDPLVPGPIRPPTPWWTRNGSFLVYRRLRQDVPLFWSTMEAEAERLAQLPGFAGLSGLALASKLVGRWPSGAPLARAPQGDDEDLGNDRFANNHFRFDSETPKLALVGGREDSRRAASPDPVGFVCPLGAHIRKVHTRDSPSDMGARSSSYERRVLRVGVPFGPSYDPKSHAESVAEERGLLFLSIQSSIEDQFEFLQSLDQR